ncbi:porin [Shewanella sp. A3A]|uniref:Porin n=1 Tax=Shewanella electrica TaxID=515560 RepID=A0ABT2FI14_9GAMM|nr:porin [Shewanella electrica]MCH1918382.1 porin [Shewanella ferrihydritica]MCH1925460.1 porin [Shewanella electrica]MCS4555285.1 porin [Shewanella electrica]
MMNAICKTLLATAIASACIASAQAADPLTVYGKLNVTVQSNDEDGESETAVQSNASRLGVKGEYDLGNSLSAFYQVEYEVATNDDSSNNFKARNQFVGLKGNFGALSVGRQDTMMKVSQGNVDQFNDLSGDLKSLFKGDNRIEQTVNYVTPALGNVRLGVTYAAEASNSQDGESGVSAALMYGDAALKSTPIYAAIAYDSKVKGYDIVRATVQGKIADLKLGAMYQSQEESEGDADSVDGYLLSAAYDINAVTLKAQYQDMEDTGDSWSVGADYKLAKPTKLFAFYTTRSMEGVSDDDNYIGLGLEHKF